ncbi:hypothetical protein [Fischerella sp. PCC 9605]|uniref:hypothetical protein n=1 Tax=Fischerella sp. PCC 9605 TaxID=1173024 RepID=UPI00047E452D|nr:hypothetical protein [Fischerella sp. PCC 9605]
MNTLQSDVVASHDWVSVQRAYEFSAPYNYAVIDNFLEPDACEYLHRKILEHWGWRYKDWISQHLHNSRLDIPEIFSIAETLKVCCPKLFQEYELITHWALMYTKNTPGRIHSDRSGINLNLWLTPEKYNLEPSRGGLVFFDVKADLTEMSTELLSSPSWYEEYVNKRTKGGKVIISYKCNRAILFDASTFHQTDVLNFAKSGVESHRINLSLAFDKPIKKEVIK